MKITPTKQDALTILELEGRLDTLSANSLEKEISKILQREDCHLLIDCTGLDFVSSSGLRVLLATAKHMNRIKRKIALSSLQPKVKDVFDLAGFTMLFPIYGTKADGIAAF